MRHKIETNAYSGSVGAEALAKMIPGILADFPGIKISLSDHRHKVQVMLNGNGAALRDLVTTLDQAGYLD